ncbi:hypothetical protein BKA61DRAFT_594707 [Leptodontidium sp. MPI-SDFR-AT-0119]|nr:hypothetical protein BKA61DRAFT_594707 [Leptodontidium sp. MPI-SDFR-AT-0119]
MLLKSLITATIAALLIPSAMGKFMTLKKHPKTTCSGKGGPWRHYTEGVCAVLSDTDHGITASYTNSGCTLYAYGSKDCTGGRISIGDDRNQDCKNVYGKGSVMVDNCP